jgi:orotidine-5'-phosphate decarboxylase
VRPAGASADDQSRIVTPGDAVGRGADWLVLGRAVTAAGDPENAAREITRAVAEALIRRPA